jgi:hypothetical protein
MICSIKLPPFLLFVLIITNKSKQPPPSPGGNSPSSLLALEVENICSLLWRGSTHHQSPEDWEYKEEFSQQQRRGSGKTPSPESVERKTLLMMLSIFFS